MGARALVAVAVCTAAFGFAGCGDDDEESGSSDTAAESGATGDAGATSGTEQNFTDAIREQLEASGVESSAIDCILDEIEGAVGEDEIAAAEEELQETGEIPSDILDASVEATTQCVGNAQ
jgi:hypothetical protein